ncbi:hypothetical protein FOA52_008109 [Chlamydomonas sp. UWO 241]|nr:hypothetical protein FOA52_008109 [Chlamydomonas sp. UWO 241]
MRCLNFCKFAFVCSASLLQAVGPWVLSCGEALAVLLLYLSMRPHRPFRFSYRYSIEDVVGMCIMRATILSAAYGWGEHSAGVPMQRSSNGSHTAYLWSASLLALLCFPYVVTKTVLFHFGADGVAAAFIFAITGAFAFFHVFAAKRAADYGRRTQQLGLSGFASSNWLGSDDDGSASGGWALLKPQPTMQYMAKTSSGGDTSPASGYGMLGLGVGSEFGGVHGGSSSDDDVAAESLADSDSRFVDVWGIKVHYKEVLPPGAPAATSSTNSSSSHHQHHRSSSSATLSQHEQQSVTTSAATPPSHHPHRYSGDADGRAGAAMGPFAGTACGAAGASSSLSTAVLLLHGFGGGVFAWRHVMESLAAQCNCRVIAFDRPGFGLTSRQHTPSSATTATAQQQQQRSSSNAKQRGGGGAASPPASASSSTATAAVAALSNSGGNSPYSPGSQAQLALDLCAQLGVRRVVLCAHADAAPVALHAAALAQAAAAAAVAYAAAAPASGSTPALRGVGSGGDFGGRAAGHSHSGSGDSGHAPASGGRGHSGSGDSSHAPPGGRGASAVHGHGHSQHSECGGGCANVGSPHGGGPFRHGSGDGPFGSPNSSSSDSGAYDVECGGGGGDGLVLATIRLAPVATGQRQGGHGGGAGSGGSGTGSAAGSGAGARRASWSEAPPAPYPPPRTPLAPGGGGGGAGGGLPRSPTKLMRSTLLPGAGGSGGSGGSGGEVLGFGSTTLGLHARQGSGNSAGLDSVAAAAAAAVGFAEPAATPQHAHHHHHHASDSSCASNGALVARGGDEGAPPPVLAAQQQYGGAGAQQPQQHAACGAAEPPAHAPSAAWPLLPAAVGAAAAAGFVTGGPGAPLVRHRCTPSGSGSGAFASLPPLPPGVGVGGVNGGVHGGGVHGGGGIGSAGAAAGGGGTPQAGSNAWGLPRGAAAHGSSASLLLERGGGGASPDGRGQTAATDYNAWPAVCALALLHPLLDDGAARASSSSLVSVARMLARSGLGWSAFGRWLLRPLLRAEVGEVANRRAWHRAERLTPEVLSLYKTPLRVDGWDSALVDMARLAGRSSGADAARPDLPTYLAAARQLPCLLLTGVHDAVVTPARSEALAQSLPHATLACVPDCGHLSHEEAPQLLLLQLAPFVRAVTQQLPPL